MICTMPYPCWRMHEHAEYNIIIPVDCISIYNYSNVTKPQTMPVYRPKKNLRWKYTNALTHTEKPKTAENHPQNSYVPQTKPPPILPFHAPFSFYQHQEKQIRMTHLDCYVFPPAVLLLYIILILYQPAKSAHTRKHRVAMTAAAAVRSMSDYCFSLIGCIVWLGIDENLRINPIYCDYFGKIWIASSFN